MMLIVESVQLVVDCLVRHYAHNLTDYFHLVFVVGCLCSGILVVFNQFLYFFNTRVDFTRFQDVVEFAHYYFLVNCVTLFDVEHFIALWQLF